MARRLSRAKQGPSTWIYGGRYQLWKSGVLRVSAEGLLLSMISPRGNLAGTCDSTSIRLECPPGERFAQGAHTGYCSSGDWHALV